MGKTRIICETGAGQHGIATATVCAKFNLECIIYMGQKDIDKQYPNVFFMKQMGATVIPVTQGSQSLVDAVDVALGDYISNPDSYYMLGSAVGPHPYPELMREAQSIISKETKVQLQRQVQKLPDYVIACIGGGSNAIGAYNEYLDNNNVNLIGIESAGLGLDVKEGHASRIASNQGSIAIMQGFKSYFLFDKEGQNINTQSIASGLNYPGIGPIHAYLHSVNRLKIESVNNQEALNAFDIVAQSEGLIIALESAHAVAYALKLAPTLSKDKVVLINVSGRGDNYLFNIAQAKGDQHFLNFCQSVGK